MSNRIFVTHHNQIAFSMRGQAFCICVCMYAQMVDQIKGKKTNSINYLGKVLVHYEPSEPLQGTLVSILQATRSIMEKMNTIHIEGHSM